MLMLRGVTVILWTSRNDPPQDSEFSEDHIKCLFDLSLRTIRYVPDDLFGLKSLMRQKPSGFDWAAWLTHFYFGLGAFFKVWVRSAVWDHYRYPHNPGDWTHPDESVIANMFSPWLQNILLTLKGPSDRALEKHYDIHYLHVVTSRFWG